MATINIRTGRTKIKFFVCYLTYILLVLLPIYQDTFLQFYLGDYNVSFVPLFSLLVFAILLVVNKGRLPKVHNRLLTTMLQISSWMSLVTFAGLFIYLFSGKSLTLYDEFLPIKGIELIIEFFTLCVYFYLLLLFATRMSARQFFQPLFFIQILLTIICLIELTQTPYAFREIHAGGIFPYWRVRLLTKESSHTSGMILVYSVLSLYYLISSHKYWQSVISLGCFLILLFSSGSKTLMICVMLYLILILLQSIFRVRGIGNFIGNVLLLIAVLSLGIILFPRLSSSFTSDLLYYSSTSTRVYTIFIAFVLGTLIPTGVGGAIYLVVFPQFLLRYMDILEANNLRTSELLSYIYSNNDYGLSPKSGMATLALYCGIVATIFFVVALFRERSLFKKSSKYSVDQLLMSEVLTIIIFMLMFASSLFSFELYIPFAAAFFVRNKALAAKSIGLHYKRNVRRLYS